MSTRTSTQLSVTSLTGGLVREIIRIWVIGWVTGVLTLPALYLVWMILAASVGAH